MSLTGPSADAPSPSDADPGDPASAVPEIRDLGTGWGKHGVQLGRRYNARNKRRSDVS